MGDEKRRQAQALLQGADLQPNLGTQPGVEIRERLVEQEDAGIDHQSTGERHALLLSAGELMRQPLGEAAEPDQAQSLRDAPVALGAGYVPHLEPETDIGGDRHMREERIALEHHAGVARIGRPPRHVLVSDDDAAACRRNEARDHSECCGLAAARGAEQGHQLALLDREGHPIHGDGGTVASADILEAQIAHDTARDRFTKRSITTIMVPISTIWQVATAARVGSMRNSR